MVAALREEGYNRQESIELLYARIEALEAAQQPQQDKLDRLIAEDAQPTGICPAPPAPDDRLRWCPTHGQQPRNAWGCPECVRELRDAADPPAPAGELVERVARVITKGDPKFWTNEARAAIHEVAKWLRSDGPDWPSVASLLEQEANR